MNKQNATSPTVVDFPHLHSTPCATEKVLPHWDCVKKALEEPIDCLSSLVDAFNQISHSTCTRLQALSRCLEDQMFARSFFHQVLPGIVRLLLRTEELFPEEIPIMRPNVEAKVSLTREQAACILAHGFFGTLELVSLDFILEREPPKTLAICHYFARIFLEVPKGLIHFERFVLNNQPEWETSTKPLCKFHIQAEGTIEDDGVNMLQADFANEFLGGGVLHGGCVQEEIRFGITNPELMAGMAFCTKMEDREAILITGTERYSNYQGYGFSLRWGGNHVDVAPRGEDGGVLTGIVAIDALPMVHQAQWKPKLILREVNKAFVGFFDHNGAGTAVATGKWGCGAFGGNPQLKTMQQLIACSEAERECFYYTFGDHELVTSTNQLVQLMREKNVTVSSLYNGLLQFWLYKSEADGPNDLYTFLTQLFSSEGSSAL